MNFGNFFDEVSTIVSSHDPQFVSWVLLENIMSMLELLFNHRGILLLELRLNIKDNVSLGSYI